MQGKLHRTSSMNYCTCCITTGASGAVVLDLHPDPGQSQELRNTSHSMAAVAADRAAAERSYSHNNCCSYNYKSGHNL